MDEKQLCRVEGGVWDSNSKQCKFVNETPKQILDKVWKVYDKKMCKNHRPGIELRRQRRTAIYWPDYNAITIRPDSWNKMHPAERRLTVIHESLHACGIPHKEGFRTSQDYASLIVYNQVYDNDFVIKDWIDKIEESMSKYLRGDVGGKQNPLLS